MILATPRPFYPLALEVGRAKCPECKGHGADPLSDNVNWLPCKTCNGTGSTPLRESRRNGGE